MANRRSSDSRRTSAPATSVGAGESTRPTTGASADSSPARTASAEPRTTRRRAAEPTRMPAAREPAVSAETRRAMIAEAAYLRAERRGFAPGREEEDWLAAEKEVDALLSAGQGGPQ